MLQIFENIIIFERADYIMKQIQKTDDGVAEGRGAIDVIGVALAEAQHRNKNAPTTIVFSHLGGTGPININNLHSQRSH